MFVGVKSIDPFVKEIIEMEDRLRLSNTVVECLKDEKRPLEKMKALGGMRVFCNTSLDHVSQVRQFHLHFIAAFMKQRNDVNHSVGITPLGSEWGFVIKDLLVKGTKFRIWARVLQDGAFINLANQSNLLYATTMVNLALGNDAKDPVWDASSLNVEGYRTMK
ncbi:hypothetical protein QAD02_001647 [Eretmocerus hayati]|uniref:Uncharacterized protein n=1 Tax=Eretmocerus hayati TaxID=131215 RepID=A0ACC2NGS0_9HYME|nr:hypothetical protein QAD02_001647 [Eretmocerus hayati]